MAHASLTTDIPLTGSPSTVQFSIVGQGRDTAARNDAWLEVISPDYFATFRISLGRGRAFTQQDAGGAPVAVVNEQFVSRFLAGRDPLRQRIVLQERAGKPAPVDWQIVGVAADVVSAQFGDRPAPKIYIPFWQRPPRDISLAIQTVSDPESMRRNIAAAMASIDAELPVARVRTMERIIDERFAPDRLNMALYGGLATIALLLAAVGIYGAMSFMVTLRRPEIGIRIALGAERPQVLFQVLGEGLALAGVGLILGLAGAYVLGRVMQSSLYGTGALSLPVWAGVSVVLLVTAAIASYLPARRASSVDPLVLLRNG